MANVEVRFFISGLETPVDALAEVLVADIRRAVREEISRFASRVRCCSRAGRVRSKINRPHR